MSDDTPDESLLVDLASHSWHEPEDFDQEAEIRRVQRGIAKIKAEAWDEGFNASENNIMDTPNPYRENGDNNA